MAASPAQPRFKGSQAFIKTLVVALRRKPGKGLFTFAQALPSLFKVTLHSAVQGCHCFIYLLAQFCA